MVKRDPVTVQFGKEHDYLGMLVNPREEGKVRISMKSYIYVMLNDSSDNFNGTALTPAVKRLFDTSDDSERLEDTRAEIFYRLTAMAFFLSWQNEKGRTFNWRSHFSARGYASVTVMNGRSSSDWCNICKEPVI